MYLCSVFPLEARFICPILYRYKIMKKVLSVFVLVFSCIGIYAQDQETVEGIVYQLNTSKFTATVARGGDSSGDIVIPESITSSYYGVKFSVTVIEALAFQGNKDITSITIPNTVTDIGAYAFQDCTSLTSATIPSSVKRIGYMAFQGCRGFNRINITDVEAWCNIQFAEYPWSYAIHLYRNDEEITDLVIPNSVTSIGKYAFLGCTSFKSVTIPSSVTSIGYRAFYGCGGLTKVNITDLAAWCNIQFGGDSDSNPLSFAHHLYLNNKEIRDLVIPSSVTSIGEYAFYGCGGLSTVTIPNLMESIGDYAFKDCNAITDIYFYTQKPFEISTKVFSCQNHATLHVLEKYIPTFQDISGWEDFIYIEGKIDKAKIMDTNGDGDVNTADVTAIYNFIINGE